MMRSATVMLTGPRKAALVETDVPEPGPGEIQVQTIVSLISIGTESFCYLGEFEEGTSWSGWVRYPFRPGYSNVARVVRVGGGVTGFAEGDLVVSLLEHRQHATVRPEDWLAIRLPEGIDLEEATWTPLAITTQTGVRHAEHSMGDTAAVIGLGQLGQLIVQYLCVLGLREVLAVDTSQPRLDMALAHGATSAFCGPAESAGDFVRDHTDGELADVVYEVTGHWTVLPQALKLARTFGKVILIGDSPQPSKQRLTQDVLARHLSIVGTHTSRLPPQHARWTAERQARLFFQYLQGGRMRLKDLTTHRITPQEVPAMYEALQVNRSGEMGILVDWASI